MGLMLITPPAVEPVTLAEARLHIKEDLAGADIDARIMMFVAAARQMAENDCRRAFIRQTWKLTLDTFPRPGVSISSANWYGPQWGNSPGPLQNLLPDGITGFEIVLPLPPLISVDAINYTDTSGVAQTLSATTDVIVNKGVEPSTVTPAYSTTWPGAQAIAGATSITFTAGYGNDGTAVPHAIRAWILAQAAAMYDLPQAELAAYRETLLEPNFVDRLLDPYRIRRYF